jgi:putative colanic acid biosynthesis acetyltransferase WcaF
MKDAILASTEAAALTGGPSFSFAFRLRRLAWIVCWTLLARWTPKSMFAWRRMLLRAFGARMTPTSRVYGSARIWWPGNLAMEQETAVGPRVVIYSMGLISIGAFTIVSQDAHLCAGTHDHEDPAFPLSPRPIAIGRHCWIAAEAFVAPGAVIADGVVLAARGVAFGRLEPWTVYRGNPAVPYRPRRKPHAVPDPA